MTTNDNTFHYEEGINGRLKHKNKRRGWKIFFIVAGILIIIRLIMPYAVLHYVNKVLAKSKEYPGHVEDINLALIRGAYVIREIRIDKADTVTRKRDSIPFFTSPRIDLSVEWKALFKGKIVGEIIVDEPKVNFVKTAPKDGNAKNDTADFKDVIKDLMPLTINRFEIKDGRIHYIDPASKPRVDVAISDIQVVATNLSNANDSNKVLPASLKASAKAYGGSADVNVRFDALQKQPTFDMNAKLDGVNMVELNEFFQAYGNFDVKKGTFGLYTEFAAKEGKFNGYVKPLLKDLDIVQFNEREGNFGQILWESVVGTVAEIFQNQREEQVATKVPINGRFDNPAINLWNAISYVLRNAFVYALQPSIDQTIDIGEVEDVDTKKTFLQKVFGKDKDKSSDKKKDDKKGSKDKNEKGEKETSGGNGW
jgi:hypothetical protein